jgi:hypothetical protein
MVLEIEIPRYTQDMDQKDREKFAKLLCIKVDFLETMIQSFENSERVGFNVINKQKEEEMKLNLHKAGLQEMIVKDVPNPEDKGEERLLEAIKLMRSNSSNMQEDYFILVQHSKNHTGSITRVSPTDDIKKVKKKIETDLKIPPHEQRLFYNGKALKDSKTLLFYGITKEGTKIDIETA